MGEYTPETLHRLWRIEMEIYQAIAKICEAHKLRYYAAYGTTLGAVRHQGFIPWDDDMDVCMPRKDYEEFLRVAPGELSEKLEILGIGFTKGYVLPFIKVQNRETTFIEETDKNLKYHTGVFVDIFPLDAVPPEGEMRERQARRCMMWIRACVLTEYWQPKLPEQMKGLTRLLAGIGCAGIHSLFRLTGRKVESFYRRFVREARRYEQEGEPREYSRLGVVLYASVVHLSETLFPTGTVPYEDIRVQVPRDPDTYLKDIYGNYMELPPAEKQHNHFPASLDFGEEGRMAGA